MFQLPKHAVTEMQPLEKSRLHPSTPISAPWQRKTAGFNPSSWLGEWELAPLLHRLKNSGIWDLNIICNIHIASNCFIVALFIIISLFLRYLYGKKVSSPRPETMDLLQGC